MTPIATIGEILAVVRERRAVKRDRDERAAIAKAFNDRYTYRMWYSGLKRAWMCPECNRVHASTEMSVWTGLQYPKCCSRGEGHRLHEGIRTS